ncbi:30S ribosomal protein S16 [Arenimonas sp.]|uniref:30S ribosomal protein S16 n=1 Tax=Arenimonas sp. TaxID=1872635 RepID=UPI0039E2AD79
MVTIRLTRRGAKKLPFYHIVVTDSRKRQGGSILEQIGFFDPVAKGKSVKLNLDLARVDYWQQNGAKLSDRVQALVADYRKQAVAA